MRMEWPLVGNITCGRRFCIRCRRWRPVYDFYVKTRYENGAPRTLASDCMTCNRVRVRENLGHKPRLWGRCQHGHSRYKNRAKDGSCLACRRERYARNMKDPEFKAQWLEYQRIYAEARRRKNGAEPRNFKNRAPCAVDEERDIDLPVGPFVDWIEDQINEKGVGVEALADQCGVDPRTIYRYRTQNDNGTVKQSVRLSIVDEALTSTGDGYLWELYPEIYEGAVA